MHELDEYRLVELNDIAFDAAIEAATEEAVAGSDEQEQLKIAIQAYLWTVETIENGS